VPQSSSVAMTSADRHAVPVPVRSPVPAVATATFEQLYDDHVDFVWRSARRLGLDESSADDVVQQTFIIVHRRWHEFEGRSTAKTWIFSILLRVVSDHRRTLRRKSPHAFHAPVDLDLLPDGSSGSDPHAALLRAEASRTIDLLLESLDGDKRVVFVLAELEDMTADEIGAATGLRRQAVYSRLRAARTDFERAAMRLRREQEARR
jgi:RNA polymerase sigma-70 factor (ECF subfamily)